MKGSCTVDVNDHKKLIEWQRKLDPANYVKATAAQYKTAPNVILPGSPDYPKGIPDDAVAISFFIDGGGWMAEREKVTVDNPTFAAKSANSKKAKFGPIVIMSETSVLAVVPASDNYYFSAYELTKHQVLTATFKPGRDNDKGKFKVFCAAAFMPSE